MKPQLLPEPLLARHIINVLAQSGTPLSEGVSYYNVGNDILLNTLDREYLGSYLADGGAAVKFAVGDYGSGKSHFLYCVRDRAWQRHFAVSKIDLSPKENPYDDQRRIYASVASSVMWHELGEETHNDQGLTSLLDGVLRRAAGLSADLLDPGTAEMPSVQNLLHTVTTASIDSLSYRQAVHGYLTSLLADQEQRQESLKRWLHGEEVSTEDLRILRSIGVTDKITKTNAFKMLRSLCQTTRAIGYTGLVLLFDEGDRMISIGSRAEKVVTDNLREVIDRCREDLPGTLFMYAVPPTFIHDIIPKYPALQQRVQTSAYFSRTNPFAPQINLDHLDIPDDQLLREIGLRLLPIFEIAYGIKLDAALQADTIDTFSKAARESYLAISHRRLFIKALVSEWYRQKEEGEHEVDLAYAAAAIRGESMDLDGQADALQVPY